MANGSEGKVYRMAIPTNIKTLLSGDVVEWARIEFKETWDPEASLKTVCAFANDLDNWGVESALQEPKNRRFPERASSDRGQKHRI